MTHIKLMVDFNLGPDHVDKLNELGAVTAKTTIDYGFNPWTSDDDLVRATLDERCILLTRDKNTINERIYKPCTHGGIIIIENPHPFPETVQSYMKAFCQSGKRSLVEHCVTHLYKDKAIIHTHKGSETVSF